MHSTMISALKEECGRRNELPRELEIVGAVHKKELAEIKEKHQEALSVLKGRVKELQAENEKLKAANCQLAAKQELSEREWRVKLEEKAAKCKEAEWKIKKAEECHRVAPKEVEKLKAEYKKKLTEMKSKCEEIIAKHKQEKGQVEERLKKVERELLEQKAMYNEELNCQLEKYKEAGKELRGMQTQRDSALEQIQTFRERVGHTKKLKHELLRAKDLLEASEEKMEELKKARTQLVEMKGRVRKLEKSEARLKNTVAELEQEKNLLQEQLENEKEKVEKEFNKERVQLMKVLADKTQQLEVLGRRGSACDGQSRNVDSITTESTSRHLFHRMRKDETMNAPRTLTSANIINIGVRAEYRQLKE